MNEHWSPVAVSIVGGLALIPPAIVGLVGVLLSRSEPRRVKELLALNEILNGIPDSDPGYAALKSYRSRLAIAHSERPVSVDPSLFSVAFLSVGWILITVTSVLRDLVRSVVDTNLREAFQVGIEVLGWLGLVTSAIGLVLLALHIVALGWRGWRGLRRWAKERRTG